MIFEEYKQAHKIIDITEVALVAYVVDVDVGPGLGRLMIIFGGMPFPVAVHLVLYVSNVLAIGFLLNDFRNKANIKPLLTIVIPLILSHICWVFQSAGWWQAIAKGFVKSFL